MFELGLIAVQNDFPNFRAWPYCGANRLGLIAVHQCTGGVGYNTGTMVDYNTGNMVDYNTSHS